MNRSPRMVPPTLDARDTHQSQDTNDQRASHGLERHFLFNSGLAVRPVESSSNVAKHRHPARGHAEYSQGSEAGWDQGRVVAAGKFR